jgi:hypothetical protein
MEKYYIVRTENAGVFFAQVEKLDGQTAKLKNSRRIWYWDGAASLSELAVNGTAKPENCKFPVSVESMTVFEVIELIECTEKAINSINSVPVWGYDNG